MDISQKLMKKYIEKFNDLFITKRSKYLILTKDGEYIQINENNSKIKLNDNHIRRHLQGKETVGVYSGDFITGFICFDVDFHDHKLAKWHTYRLIDTLVELGVKHEYIYPSTSGNKGYHVEIYFDKVISLELSKKFYELVIEAGNLISDDGKIEFRPSQQGVKLPLGTNFKNKNNFTNKCWYVDYEKGLEPIRNYDYLFNIKKIDSHIIFEIVDSFKDLTINDLPKQKDEGIEVESSKDYIDSNYKSLSSYKLNIDPNATIEAAIQLENEGLKYKGTRHNSLFLLCRYYKHLGLSEYENRDALTEWINKQNKNTYTSNMKEVINLIFFITCP